MGKLRRFFVRLFRRGSRGSRGPRERRSWETLAHVVSVNVLREGLLAEFRSAFLCERRSMSRRRMRAGVGANAVMFSGCGAPPVRIQWNTNDREDDQVGALIKAARQAGRSFARSFGGGAILERYVDASNDVDAREHGYAYVEWCERRPQPAPDE